MNEEWQPISTAPIGEVVMTKIDDENGARNDTALIFDNNLWWFPDRSMYVYYQPTHWRRARELSRETVIKYG